ncbi:hypothetical protein ACFLT7_05055 [candidate division KSB1 bacterium]
MAAKQSGKDKVRQKEPVKQKRKEAVSRGKLPFDRRNYSLFAVGLAAISIGFVTLSKGSMTLAPILLILGYCVIIPLAIILK